MGLLIVMIVGIVLGWLCAMLFERDERVGGDVCALAGTIGAVTGAVLGGRVPLLAGVTPTQLLWAVLGALTAIIASNAVALNDLHWGDSRNV